MNDGAALGPLREAMAACGEHDQVEIVANLEIARGWLGERHAGAELINAAVVAAESQQWKACWYACWQVMTSLVWVFPPEISTCPPEPQDQPRAPAPASCGGCGTLQERTARFCPQCGQNLSVA